MGPETLEVNCMTVLHRFLHPPPSAITTCILTRYCLAKHHDPKLQIQIMNLNPLHDIKLWGLPSVYRITAHLLAAPYISACVEVAAVAQGLISPGVQDLPAAVEHHPQQQQQQYHEQHRLLPVAQACSSAACTTAATRNTHGLRVQILMQGR